MVNAGRSDEQERRLTLLLGIPKFRALAQDLGFSPETFAADIRHLDRFMVLHGEKNRFEEYGLRYASFEDFKSTREFLETLFFEWARHHDRWARVYDLDSHADPVDFLVFQEVRIPR